MCYPKFLKYGNRAKNGQRKLDRRTENAMNEARLEQAEFGEEDNKHFNKITRFKGF